MNSFTKEIENEAKSRPQTVPQYIIDQIYDELSKKDLFLTTECFSTVNKTVYTLYLSGIENNILYPTPCSLVLPESGEFLSLFWNTPNDFSENKFYKIELKFLASGDLEIYGHLVGESSYTGFQKLNIFEFIARMYLLHLDSVSNKLT